MSAAGSYPHADVADDRRVPPPLETPGTAEPSWARATAARPEEASSPDDAADRAEGPGPDPVVEAIAADGIDLSALSIAGIKRRHLGWVAAALVSAWIVVVFARQSAEASSAANRADQIAGENAALTAEIKALEAEFRLIERSAYVAQQARGYRIGTAGEIPFTLDPSVPDPGPNAPGSASARLGADEARVTPLESWLSLLFGPTD
jgi:cell division protein FtsB